MLGAVSISERPHGVSCVCDHELLLELVRQEGRRKAWPNRGQPSLEKLQEENEGLRARIQFDGVSGTQGGGTAATAPGAGTIAGDGVHSFPYHDSLCVPPDSSPCPPSPRIGLVVVDVP